MVFAQVVSRAVYRPLSSLLANYSLKRTAVNRHGVDSLHRGSGRLAQALGWVAQSFWCGRRLLLLLARRAKHAGCVSVIAFVTHCMSAWSACAEAPRSVANARREDSMLLPALWRAEAQAVTVSPGSGAGPVAYAPSRCCRGSVARLRRNARA